MSTWTFTQTGEGPALVILHGIFGDRNNWKTVAQKIPGHTLYYVDLPGHGETPSPKSWALADLARDGWSWMEANRIDHPILLGHSWGGKIAWEMALQRPDSVRALIIGDIGPLTTPIEILRIGTILNQAAAQNERDGVKAVLLQHFPPNLAGFFLKSWKGGERAWVFDLPAFIQHAETLRQGLPPGRIYPGPTLQIWGKNSEYPTPEALEASRPFFPQLTTAFVEGAGHWFHAENPQKTLEIVTDFIHKL